MEMNEELIYWLKKFKEVFNDTVPLMQIDRGISNEELILIIKKCIDENKNLLPEFFGYDSKDVNKKY
jgi:hypothetical protein